MGEALNDDSILDIVLGGLTDDYVQIKYSAGADKNFSLDHAVITMRNMDAYRVMRNGPSRKAKGRESAMVTTSTSSAVVTCSHCKKAGHRFQNCFFTQKIDEWEKTFPYTRNNSWCSLHNTDRHDINDCLAQKQERESGNRSRSFRPGQQNGQRNNDSGAHANRAITPSPTTQVEAYSPAIYGPSATTTAATTTATSTSTTTPSSSSTPSTPPDGIGYSFIAATSTDITTKSIDSSMTADRGASSHFIDSQLLEGIESKMAEYVHLDPPVTINVAGNHRLFGIGKGVLVVNVIDPLGSNHPCSFLSRSYPGWAGTYFRGEQQRRRESTWSSPSILIWT